MITKFECRSCNPEDPCVLLIPDPLLTPYICPMKDEENQRNKGATLVVSLIRVQWEETSFEPEHDIQSKD
jgi:hypothetical protein